MRPYYEHEGITIYHGDCLDMLSSVPGDVLVTDPPYGIQHASNRAGAPRRGHTIANDHTSAVRDAVLAFWGDRPAVIFGTCRAPLPCRPRAVLVWDKGGHVGMGDLELPWKQNWEHIYILGCGFAGRRGSGVLRVNALAPWAGRYTHPHEKPVSLLLHLLVKCPVGVILDPFMGSGTTIVAARRLGRRAVGIELEERYCEIAAQRLSQGALPLEFTA